MTDFDDRTVANAIRLLATWERPPLESAEVQAWVLRVLGYFKSCYADGGSRNTAALTVDHDRDPMGSIHTHAGVLFVWEYYPEFWPTPDHFAMARWGRR